MKKTFTSLRKTTSAIAALVISGMTFNASAEKLSGNTATEIAGMMNGRRRSSHKKPVKKFVKILQKYLKSIGNDAIM